MGHGLSGWVARNRRTLINGDPRVSFEAAGIAGEIALNSAIVCPLQYNDTFIGCLALYHVEAEPLHRGSPPAARADRGAGRRRHPQLDRVRADAGRFADRSADRAAEPPLDVRAPVARAGARRAPQERGRDHRHGHRRVQGDQRHLRAQRRRPRAARGRPTRCRARCGPTTCASATPATSSSSCWRTARARRPTLKRRELQAPHRRDPGRSPRRQAAPARRQRRRRGVPARRHDLRRAARRRRSPDVSRQGGAPRPRSGPEAPRARTSCRPTCTTPAVPSARPTRCRRRSRRPDRFRVQHRSEVRSESI